MTARRAYVLNYLAYQIGWGAAVVGAATGYGAAGALAAATLTLGHVALAHDRAGEARLVLVALLSGLLVESWQIAGGTYRTLAEATNGMPPAWLLALWAQFATTWRFSLAHLMARPWAAAAFGAVGGPVAFLAGERLGAVELTTPLVPGLVRLVVGWAAALAVAAWVVRRWPSPSPGRYRGAR